MSQEASPRIAHRTRATKETAIDLTLNLDGSGVVSINTGISFFDHMLEQIGRHGSFDLSINAKGDLDVDTHHTIEDVGIVLGEALSEALGDKAGIERYASRVIPLDEAAIEVALDISGRPFMLFEVPFAPDTPGLGQPPFDPQLTEEFFRAVATSAGLTLHVRMRSGRNVHHIVEATFKAFARCLRDAVAVNGHEIPSTKGSL